MEPQAKMATVNERVDCETHCPFLLRVFCSTDAPNKCVQLSTTALHLSLSSVAGG